MPLGAKEMPLLSSIFWKLTENIRVIIFLQNNTHITTGRIIAIDVLCLFLTIRKGG